MGGSETLEPNVLELDLHGRPGVELHRQETHRVKIVIVVVCDLGDEFAVDAEQEVSPLRDQVILMPLIKAEIIRGGFNRQFFGAFGPNGIEHGSFSLQCEVVPAEFIVEPCLPRLAVIVIDLVAAHISIRQPAASELKTTVDHRGVGANHAESDLEFKVIEHSPLPDEILIQLRGVLG